MGAKLHRARGEEPRPSTKVPKFSLDVTSGDHDFLVPIHREEASGTLSVKGGEVSYTARRLA